MSSSTAPDLTWTSVRLEDALRHNSAHLGTHGGGKCGSARQTCRSFCQEAALSGFVDAKNVRTFIVAGWLAPAD